MAGTTAMDGAALIGKNDLYGQTVFILEKIRRALRQVGADWKDVVRTRMYITDIRQWESAGRAHGEVFAHIKPVATMVEVSRLIHEDLLIEMEVTAILETV